MASKPPATKRIIAYIIDSIIVGIAAAVLIGASFILPVVLAFVSPTLAGLSTIFIFIALGVWSIFAIGYTLLRDGLGSGRSIGKKFMGLKVVKDGNKCGFKDSLLRNITLMVLGPIDPIIALLDKDGMRLGDKIAKTQVVEA
jgi:uncharacterized RDD family membrane protein YckC